MIERYHKIGVLFAKFRILIIGILCISCWYAVELIIGNDSTKDDLLLASITLSIWLVLALSISYFFSKIALPPVPGSGFFKRARYRIKRVFSFVVATLFTLNTIMLLWLTLKTIGHVV